jgi:hypothetical protein
MRGMLLVATDNRPRNLTCDFIQLLAMTRAEWVNSLLLSFGVSVQGIEGTTFK